MKPYHKHDSDTSDYLGSESVNSTNYDYYYAGQSGFPTVIARFGEYGDYYSSLLIVKSILNKHSKLSTIEQLNQINKKDEDIYVLVKATILSIEQGHLNNNLKPINSKKSLKIK